MDIHRSTMCFPLSVHIQVHTRIHPNVQFEWPCRRIGPTSVKGICRRLMVGRSMLTLLCVTGGAPMCVSPLKLGICLHKRRF